ncbi:MAG TPA: DUF721 domain-containing protein [Candidatus Aquicultor sp.]|jgi:hypothetical protein
MKRLSDAFDELERGGPLAGKFTELKALSVWDEIVGRPVCECARPLRIRSGVLYVATKSPAWSQELKALEGNIRRKINAAIGEQVVREIRFTCRQTEPATQAEPEMKDAPPLAAVKLSDDEQDFIDDIVDELPEDELRDRLKRLAEKDKKLKRWRAQGG